jgi:hypothetical protein
MLVAAASPVRRSRRWWIHMRLGLAGALLAICGLAGLSSRCADMPGSGFVALLLTATVLCACACGSFVAGAVAWVGGDLQDARAEALVGTAMLLSMPAALVALAVLTPDCAC